MLTCVEPPRPAACDSAERIDLKKVLIVCLRRIGDVLLATPLAHSVRQHDPDIRIDWLVFEPTAGVLSGNPAVDRVFTLPTRPSFLQSVLFCCRLFLRYDVAISTQSGDRPSFYARLASLRATTFASSSKGGRLRDIFFSSVVRSDTRIHESDRVLMMCDVIGIKASRKVLTPRPSGHAVHKFGLSGKSYIVIHPGAAFAYKRWNKEGWHQLIANSMDRGFQVVVTGGNSLEEKSYLDEILSGTSVLRLDGSLLWNELVEILLSAKACVVVDTSVAHLAAALAVPGAAIFGPTDPAVWAPRSSGQNRMLKVIQNTQACVPCQEEGCDRHRQSRAECLDTLQIDRVWPMLEPHLT